MDRMVSVFICIVSRHIHYFLGQRTYPYVATCICMEYFYCMYICLYINWYNYTWQPENASQISKHTP